MSNRIDGRIYTSGDLHAAALVWIDRRKTIEKLLIKDFPHLNLVDLMGVLRAVELYATCNETLFVQMEEKG